MNLEVMPADRYALSGLMLNQKPSSGLDSDIRIFQLRLRDRKTFFDR